MYSTLERTFLLRSVSLFDGIPAETLSRIAGITEEISQPAGTRLFSGGDHGDSLYVVASGEVRIHKGDVELATLGQGACFGEMALLDESPRSADATVAADATLFKIQHEEFDELLSANAEIARSIMRLLSARLREANEKLAEKGS